MARTAEQVREEFKKSGISIAAWARANGYSVQAVFAVLSGNSKPTRGQTHNIAVMLGLKDGRIVNSPKDIFGSNQICDAK